MSPLWITGDPDCDDLLESDPFALLVGMLLDQQVAMEVAFAGPAKIAERLGAFSPKAIATADPSEFEVLFAAKPAVHRYPSSMAGRVQALARHIVEQEGADASTLWTRGDPDGREVLRRLKALPGFGDQKARIFLALLGKQRGLTADGWREAAGPYGEEGSRRSIADVTSSESLAEVRETKRAAKAAAKAARG